MVYSLQDGTGPRAAAGIDLPFPSSYFVAADAASPTGVRYSIALLQR
jgi:hypothetical protein